MSVQVEKLEKNMAKLTIEVAPEELEKAIEELIRRIRARSAFPDSGRVKYPAR